MKPNPKKLQAIRDFTQPKTVTQIKSFLGLTGYYCKFIRNFAKHSKPLTILTKKDQPFRWTNEQQTAFDYLKTKLCEDPILDRSYKYPDFSQQFTLTTDASNESIGAVFSQNNLLRCFISHTLNPAEKNTTTEKELLAIVWAIK